MPAGSVNKAVSRLLAAGDVLSALSSRRRATISMDDDAALFLKSAKLLHFSYINSLKQVRLEDPTHSGEYSDLACIYSRH